MKRFLILSLLAIMFAGCNIIDKNVENNIPTLLIVNNSGYDNVKITLDGNLVYNGTETQSMISLKGYFNRSVNVYVTTIDKGFFSDDKYSYWWDFYFEYGHKYKLVINKDSRNSKIFVIK